MPYCDECGSKVLEDDAFCSSCGANLQPQGAAPQAEMKGEASSPASSVAEPPWDATIKGDENVLKTTPQTPAPADLKGQVAEGLTAGAAGGLVGEEASELAKRVSVTQVPADNTSPFPSPKSLLPDETEPKADYNPDTKGEVARSFQKVDPKQASSGGYQKSSPPDKLGPGNDKPPYVREPPSIPSKSGMPSMVKVAIVIALLVGGGAVSVAAYNYTKSPIAPVNSPSSPNSNLQTYEGFEGSGSYDGQITYSQNCLCSYAGVTLAFSGEFEFNTSSYDNPVVVTSGSEQGTYSGTDGSGCSVSGSYSLAFQLSTSQNIVNGVQLIPSYLQFGVGTDTGEAGQETGSYTTSNCPGGGQGYTLSLDSDLGGGLIYGALVMASQGTTTLQCGQTYTSTVWGGGSGNWGNEMCPASGYRSASGQITITLSLVNTYQWQAPR